MRSAAIILLVALIKVPVLPVPISGVNPECFLDYIQAYELSPALLLAGSGLRSSAWATQQLVLSHNSHPVVVPSYVVQL